ncbi:MAG: aconitate hydratase, partial [Clostridia bacterium]|nr:aconitate hydratase [Clostridia bacterium]
GAKDVILEVLRRLSVKGGVGAVMEYVGEGVKTLSVPQRATITNMGAELGATSSLFPSDEVTRDFLVAQGRGEVYTPLAADPDAVYDESVTVDLSALVPLAACPHSPDAVKTVKELEGTRVSQVCIGSCTNSSLADMLTVAAMLRGRRVHPNVSLSISPGSRQVLVELSRTGALADILSAGARLLECACGPCIGMGFSPESAGVSLRTFNRNFEGRSGTKDAEVYLVSPETAVAAAIFGEITDPSRLGPIEPITLPERFAVDDSMILMPDGEGEATEVVRGPNIKPVPKGVRPAETLRETVLLKVGDNITTDHIMPAGTKILPYRSNVPYLSQFCFRVSDETFAERAKAAGSGVIVGGANYGQGSSREHAALVPLYLGIRAVVAKSFARIHSANLVNAGIVPLVFADPADYDAIAEGEELVIPAFADGLRTATEIPATVGGRAITLLADFTERQRAILAAGGLLNYTKESENR